MLSSLCFTPYIRRILHYDGDIKMASALRFTDANFEEEVLKSDIPVLVDFWASWCPPCKMVEPIIDELAEEYDGRIKIGKLHVDRNPKTGARYQITGVPTFILFVSGSEVLRKVGAQSKEQLRRMLNGVNFGKA